MIRFINKQLFYDQRKQQNAGNKLGTYRTFKTNIKQEKKMYRYLTKNILCKFRISSHGLEIEKERYQKLKQENESVNCVMLK